MASEIQSDKNPGKEGGGDIMSGMPPLYNLEEHNDDEGKGGHNNPDSSASMDDGGSQNQSYNQNRNNSKTSKKNKKKRNGRHGARNQHRHKLMVKWIANKFPDAFQAAKEKQVPVHQSQSKGKNHAKADSENGTGSGAGAGEDEKVESTSAPATEFHLPQHHILDVAGGKGELSARMTLCHTLHVRMVDPRPADILHVFQKTVFRSLPKKWQERINSHADGSVLEGILKRRYRQLEQCFPSDGQVEGVLQELQERDGNKDLLDAVERSSLLIGMHADGATEAIVDVALHYRKPFVVVPCCVFPNFFQHRFVPAPIDSSIYEDGTSTSTQSDNVNGTYSAESERMVPVRSHEQFCEYLARKDSHLIIETLPFEGRNLAIWWDGIHRDGD